MDTVIVTILSIIFIACIYRGVVGTFKRQPVVAILMMIFLLPFYIIWAIVEVIISILPEKKTSKDVTDFTDNE
jgi:peptidoglycan biosynthesis protein MviN/MurJ (putative lipid II flippase)